VTEVLTLPEADFDDVATDADDKDVSLTTVELDAFVAICKIHHIAVSCTT